MIKDILITIDGPAASGKTTCSKLLAYELGFKYVDTGALYRAVAFHLMEKGVDINSESAVSTHLDGIGIDFKKAGDENAVFLNGKDITSMIRTPKISMAASKISSYSAVRSFLFKKQKELGNGKNVVFEGRDMGTVLFPDADVKFFLDARQEIRAKRRFFQMGGEISGHSYDEILISLADRDKADSTRSIAPLKPADDSVFVDSSFVLPSEVVEKMIDHIFLESTGKSDLLSRLLA